MKILIILYALLLAGCIAPQKEYNTYIHCQGNGNTVNITLEVEAATAYDAEAKSDIDADVRGL